MDSKIENIAELSQLSEDYSSVWLQAKYSDVTLLVSGEKIPAHKVILAARSSYFNKKLYESTTNEVVLEASNTKSFKILLKYLYSGFIALEQLEMLTILTMFELAREYLLTSLGESLIEVLKRSLNIENVVVIFNFARTNHIQDLITECEIFLDSCAPDIVAHDSFQLLSEESVVEILKRNSFCVPELDIFKAVAKWSQENFEKAKEVVKYVRFALIKPFDITQFVRPTGIVDNEVLWSAIHDSLSGKLLGNRARLIMNKDVASPEMGAKYWSGKLRALKNYRFHTIPKIKESWNQGIMLVLKEVTQINNICMLLRKSGTSPQYSYYIKVSTDMKNWTKVVDYSSYVTRTFQDLYFEQCPVKYIKVVGTASRNANNEFHLVYLQAYCRTAIPRHFQSVIYPEYNVASVESCAIKLRHADSDVCLDGNYTNYNATEGYTTGPKICINLGQPYMISYIKFLLLDCDDRSYSFKIDTRSGSGKPWQLIIDKREAECKSWQTFYFKEHVVNSIHIRSTKELEPLRIVHFECMYKPPEESDHMNGQEEACFLASSDNLSVQEGVPEKKLKLGN